VYVCRPSYVWVCCCKEITKAWVGEFFYRVEIGLSEENTYIF